MSISSMNSGVALLKTSDSLAQKAASEIAHASGSSDLQFNKINNTQSSKPPSVEQSITDLQQASSYSKAGANVIQTSNDIIGTLLDTHV
ncbi:hypothetical protein R3X26_03395 [Vibrio sp. TH_r3]|uniref:hypothetical protein n=1 Tax=Vibrio sp. TH_r3 TaxID=3082084 RepID=UPI002954F13A|nr:hypothetical protein [Vibrio sp. TH_r3]MDV7103447.1 hypothetical protein [Vibrio sp. TH_r3]